MSEFMTTAEVAELLRQPVETVRYWRHVGKGPKSFKIGRRVLYDTGEVEQWLAEQRPTPSVKTISHQRLMCEFGMADIWPLLLEIQADLQAVKQALGIGSAS